MTVTDEAVIAALAALAEHVGVPASPSVEKKVWIILEAADPYMAPTPVPPAPRSRSRLVDEAEVEHRAAAWLHEAAAHLRRLDGQVSALGTDRAVTADWLDEMAGRRG